MEVKEKSKYFLRDNYNKVFKKSVLALIKTNDSLQNLREIKRVIKKKRQRFEESKSGFSFTINSIKNKENNINVTPLKK
jgi:hypothetical protein